MTERETDYIGKEYRRISLYRHGGPKIFGDGPLSKEGLIATQDHFLSMYDGIPFLEDPDQAVIFINSGSIRAEQTAEIMENHLKSIDGSRVLEHTKFELLNEANAGNYYYSLDEISKNEGRKRHWVEVWFDDDYPDLYTNNQRKAIEKAKAKGVEIDFKKSRPDKTGRAAIWGTVDFLIDVAEGNILPDKREVPIVAHGPARVLLLRQLQEVTKQQLLPSNWREMKVDDLAPYGSSIEFIQLHDNKDMLYVPLTTYANDDKHEEVPQQTVVKLSIGTLKSLQANLETIKNAPTFNSSDLIFSK